MKYILLIIVAAYVFFAALVAYPHGIGLVTLMEYKVSFQVAEALREAGWEDVRVSLVWKHKSAPPVYTVDINASTDEEFKLVTLFFGEGGWERVAYLKAISNPDPTYTGEAVQLSDNVALYLADSPERIAKTVDAVLDYTSPVEPTRKQLWSILLRHGKTEIRYYDNWLTPVGDTVLLLLEPGRRLLLSLLLLLPLTTMPIVFQIWKVIIFLFPGAFFFITFFNRVRSANLRPSLLGGVTLECFTSHYRRSIIRIL
jgi:hypothetical protein